MEERELGVPQTRTLALRSTTCCHGCRVQYLGILPDGVRQEKHKATEATAFHHGLASRWTPREVKPEGGAHV